jgi:hypothetical protein
MPHSFNSLLLLASVSFIWLLALPTSGQTNLLVNGDISSGNTGFSSGYTYSPGNLVPTGMYDVVSNPNDDNPPGASMGDHTTGTGLMLAVNGSSNAAQVVWSETINVATNTSYVLSGWAASWGDLNGSGLDPAPAVLVFSVNGTPVGNPLRLPAQDAAWTNFGTVWNSQLATQAVIQVTDLVTDWVGNDFALDDMFFAPLNGLVAYYPFNGNANDASGNGYDGVAHGATTVPDYLGNPDSAYSLNGTNAYIYFGPILPDMQTFTVAAWVKSSGGGTFFADADWQPDRDFTIGLATSNTVIRCDKPPAPLGSSYTISLTNRIDGVWRNMAWVVRTNLIQVFVDGGLKRFTVIQGGGDVGYHDFIIGTMEFPYGGIGWGGYWRGDVSKLRIYNRALAASEIQQLYAYDSLPRLSLLELDNPGLRVVPLLDNLALGSNYQLKVSTDLNTWTNSGSVITATNNSMMYPGYWSVDNASQLFFRLQVAP